MKRKLTKITSIILILTGLIIIGSISIWSPVCENLIELASGNMTHMRCYYTGQASILLSILLIVGGIESLITNSKKPWIFLSIGIMFILVTFDTKLGIGICMKETMSCHNTAIWIRGGGAITILASLASLFSGRTIR